LSYRNHEAAGDFGEGDALKALGLQHGLANAAMIAAIVAFATVGDAMIAAAMRVIGDLDDIKVERGLSGAILTVLGSGHFVAGIFFMALGFFALLFALSHSDLSLVAPAATSLTSVTNTWFTQCRSVDSSPVGRHPQVRPPGYFSGVRHIFRQNERLRSWPIKCYCVIKVEQRSVQWPRESRS
jgi:hypothetical protein